MPEIIEKYKILLNFLKHSQQPIFYLTLPTCASNLVTIYGTVEKKKIN